MKPPAISTAVGVVRHAGDFRAPTKIVSHGLVRSGAVRCIGQCAEAYDKQQLLPIFVFFTKTVNSIVSRLRHTPRRVCDRHVAHLHSMRVCQGSRRQGRSRLGQRSESRVSWTRHSFSVCLPRPYCAVLNVLSAADFFTDTYTITASNTLHSTAATAANIAEYHPANAPGDHVLTGCRLGLRSSKSTVKNRYAPYYSADS